MTIVEIGPLPRLDTGRFNFGRALLQPSEKAPKHWQDWLRVCFPAHFSAGFSDRHVEFWEWIEAIRPGVKPRSFVAVWPRGGAKSTSAETAVIRLGAKKARKYGWYVSGTQDKADKHVETISTMLETNSFANRYPAMAERKLSKYGHSRGWRRNRLWTASNFTVDALGLDTGARGAKREEKRPDFIVLDDIDDRHDSKSTIKKKIEIITDTILPAGSNDCAILFVQNLIHVDSIASQMIDERADFLIDRIISGPHMAVDNLAYEQRHDPAIDRKRYYITSGAATWEGQSLDVCELQINEWGLSSFLRESQHEVEITGGIWDHVEFQHVDWRDLPDLIRVVVWVDPAVTSTDESDSMGICAGGVDERDNIYMLYAWEDITSPTDAITRAILKAMELGAQHVGVETDQGGDTWIDVYERACDKLVDNPDYPDITEDTKFPVFASDKAGAGYGSKLERNQRMLTDYERGLIIHATGTHNTLERALRRFPNKPLDLSDAAFWVWNDLGGGGWDVY